MKALKTIKVTESVWKETKVNAAKLGKSIGDYVTDALNAYKTKKGAA